MVEGLTFQTLYFAVHRHSVVHTHPLPTPLSHMLELYEP